jgi:hypothetical protein
MRLGRTEVLPFSFSTISKLFSQIYLIFLTFTKICDIIKRKIEMKGYLVSIMTLEVGLTRSEYRIKYQIQDSSFNYNLQSGRIGIASKPFQTGEVKSRVRGLTYINKAPLTDREIIESDKYLEDGSKIDNSEIISLHELAEVTGVTRLSKLSSLVHAFASAEGIDVLHFTCFPFKEQTIYLVGLKRGLEVPFKKWLQAQKEVKVQSRKNRISGVVAYQEATPEVLSKLYPYNVVASAFKGSEENLFRVSPAKLKTYLKDKTTKQMRDDIRAIYFKGIPVVQWAEKQGISKAAMYMRLDRYTEQFAKDQEHFMFGK